MKMYKVLDTKINREYSIVNGAENLIGKTLKGELSGEYVKLETGHCVLASEVEEIKSVMYDYVNANKGIQVYTVVEMNSNYSEIKIKNAICKRVLEIEGFEKSLSKTIKSMIHEGSIYLRKGYEQIEVTGDFTKKEAVKKQIKVLNTNNGIMEEIEAEKINSKVLDNVYITTIDNSKYYNIIYKNVSLFTAKTKKEIEENLKKYGVEKIENYVDDILVKYKYIAPHTKDQLKEYAQELKEEIQFKKERLKRLQSREEKRQDRINCIINEIEALRNELKLVSGVDEKEEINITNKSNNDTKINTVDSKIKTNNVKIKIYNNKIDRLELKRDSLLLEINKNNIRLNDKDNNLIQQLINIDNLISTILNKIDLLKEDIKHLKNIKFKAYTESLKTEYGCNKYKIINRNNNIVIYSNNIENYLNNFNYNIFVLIKDAEYIKQVYYNNNKFHKHYTTEPVFYLKDTLKINYYKNNDTDANIIKYYHIDRNNKIVLIEEYLKKDRIKVHYMKCCLNTSFISINYKQINEIDSDLYNKTLIAFKDNEIVTDILYNLYNKHIEYLKNYTSPTFEDKKQYFISKYTEIVNNFKDLKKVVENLKYYSNLYKNNIYKFYRDYKTNSVNFSNYLYNYNELNRLLNLNNNCKEYNFKLPKKVVYTKNYRKTKACI